MNSHHHRICRATPGLRIALIVALMTVGLSLTSAAPAAAAPRMDAITLPGVLVAPTVRLGPVRGLLLHAVHRALRAMLQFSTQLRVLDDTATVAANPAAVARRPSHLARVIAVADRDRQKAIDLAAADYRTRAYERFVAAVSGYEAAITELVDFNKLADTMVRAGVSAWYAHKGAAVAQGLFAKALALQPTALIDRRGTNAKLLALFDNLRKAQDRAPHASVTVRGDIPGAHAFVDGIDVGSLPAGRGGLPPGTHYLQVRDRRTVHLARRFVVQGANLVFEASSAPAKKPTARKPAQPSTSMKDVANCAARGAFRSRPCRKQIAALGRRTGARYVLFPALTADTFGALTLHTFLVETQTGRTVEQPPISVASDLGDMHARLGTMQSHVALAARDFDHQPALTARPAMYR